MNVQSVYRYYILHLIVQEFPILGQFIAGFFPFCYAYYLCTVFV